MTKKMSSEIWRMKILLFFRKR